MRNTFRNQVHTLKEYANRFDTTSQETKLQCLRNLSAMTFLVNKDLITYFETLLFLIAYPSNARQLFLSEKELLRITKFLKASGGKQNRLLSNSGMPYTQTVTRLSHDSVRWLLTHPDCTTTLHSFEEPSLQLNDVLRLSLTSLEKSETTAGLSNTCLMDILLVSKQQRLQFLVNELARLDHLPYIKDHLFDRLELFVCIIPRNKVFSKAYNRLPNTTTFFHQELLKKFEVTDILHRPLPSASITEEEKNEAIGVVKNSMTINARETDPTTFMEERSFRLYHLDRGISIAIYGMIPSRQLPLESYVGFTAFKNGFPAAYGGAWIFGERSNFGINIFESFRSGESGYIMAQLLRLYIQVFNIHYVEVEPYQFGLHNPEGIESGAFWFYYRFGFRPLDRYLLQIAKKEYEKIQTKRGYRTSHKTLIQFTERSIGLKLAKYIPPKVADITSKVTRMIQRTYNGNRLLAEIDCRQKFLTKTDIKELLTESENQVLTEVALWAEALNVKEIHRLDIMGEMIKTKPKDVFAYQSMIIRFFFPFGS